MGMHFRSLLLAGILFSLVAARGATLAETPLAAAIAAARQYEPRPNYPTTQVKKAAVLLEAAKLSVATNPDLAAELVDEASALLAGYNSTGKELVPVLLPAFRASILEGRGNHDLSGLDEKSSDPTMKFAYGHLGRHFGRIDPKLMMQLANTAGAGELPILVALSVGLANPSEALELAASLDANNNPQQKYMRLVAVSCPAAIARARGVAIPSAAADLLNSDAPFVFKVLEHDGPARVGMMMHADAVAVAWSAVNPRQANPELRKIIRFKPREPRSRSGSKWEQEWQKSTQRLRHDVTLAALQDAAGDQGRSDKTLAKAFATADRLQELQASQPKQDSQPGGFARRYEINLAGSCRTIPLLSVRVANRIATQAIKRGEEPDGTDFWLELIACTKDEARAMRIADRIGPLGSKA